MNSLQMNIYGSCLVGMILLLRAAGRYRLPTQTFVILWDIAALRFLIPWEISSPLSLYGLFSPGAQGQISAIPIRVQTGILETAAEDIAMPAAEPFFRPWEMIWAAGALLCGALFLFLYFRWLGRFAQSLPVASAEIEEWRVKHPLRRRLAIRQSQYIRAPLTYGIFCPVILLPKGAEKQSGRTLEYVLTHEYIHIRRLDVLRKLLWTAAACVNWFNPCVWLLYFLANRDVEISCDEAVLKNCAGRAAYARMLISMEEQPHGLAVFSSCSRQLVKERIRFIMKGKRRTVFSLALAGILAAAVSTAFATSPPVPRESEQTENIPVVTQETSDTSVEWWTPEEYAQWLEQEKAALQSLLGQKAWTSSDGNFIWTQEKIDETIAMYEETLAQLKRGARISKPTDEGVILFMDGTAQEAVWVEEPADAPSLGEYAAFGLEEEHGELQYKGQPVAYFEDAVSFGDGFASRAVICNVASPDDFDPVKMQALRTVRQETRNPDGSTDPFGILLGLEEIPPQEAKAYIEAYLNQLPQNTCTAETAVEESDIAAGQVLEKYAPFGLTWQETPDGLSMFWKGRRVHSLFDPQTGVWAANNTFGSDLGPEALDLEAVYENGTLTGLQESAAQHTHVAAATIETLTAVQEQGQTFEEIFSRFAPYGLSFEKISSPDGTGYNLFYRGQPVNRFTDEGPDHVFTFDSYDQKENALSICVRYKEGTETIMNLEAVSRA